MESRRSRHPSDSPSCLSVISIALWSHSQFQSRYSTAAFASHERTAQLSTLSAQGFFFNALAYFSCHLFTIRSSSRARVQQKIQKNTSLCFKLSNSSYTNPLLKLSIPGNHFRALSNYPSYPTLFHSRQTSTTVKLFHAQSTPRVSQRTTAMSVTVRNIPGCALWSPRMDHCPQLDLSLSDFLSLFSSMHS